jgi:ParB/RepB/Spo0J family partition protein
MPYKKVGDIILVPLVDIYVDTRFNCRGWFAPQEVYSLGQAIREEGLLQPLTIQPMDDVDEKEQPSEGAWAFRLLAGHRRYMAMDKWTSMTEAPCIVKPGLSYHQARVLNFTDNLQRHDLNVLQEAHSLESTWPDYDVNTIAKLIGKPKRWVKARKSLIHLPDYVQRRAALPQGGLTDKEIEILADVLPERVEPVFQQLVAGTYGYRPRTSRAGGGWTGRPRGKQEINAMIGLLFKSRSFSELSDTERDYITSTLAWVTKGIDSVEFMENRLGYPADCVIVDSNDRVTGFKD